MATKTKKTMTKNFLHKHTLEFNDKHCEDYCSVCGRPISDRHYYRCSECPEICIHQYPCSEIPFQMDHHPLHPHHTIFVSDKVDPFDSCVACRGYCYGGFAYKCIDCAVILDIKCALLTPTTTTSKTNQKIQIQLKPTHPHPLISCNKDKNFSYTCCCCHFSIDGGWVYVCLQCKGFFHNSCAELPWEIEHPFHSSHPLVLCSQPRSHYGERFLCSVCCKIRDGFAYQCSVCEFFLDIHCASLKPEGQIQRFKHSHPVFFCHNKEKFSYPCYACGLPLADSIYFCPECCVLLHKSCADLPQEINHLLHPQHTLTLRDHRNTLLGSCAACFCSSYCFFYECSECKWYMDVRCAFLSKPAIMRWSKIHRHPLALILKPKSEFISCDTCHKYCHIPFFRCVWCNFNIHVHCVSPLPPTLKYKNHVHRLTLSYNPIKDRPDEDDDAEFYCDACEERRELALPTYFCEACHYVAHPYCVASEIIHILEEECSKHEKVEEPSALTLEGFLNSFTEDENKEVQGLFEAYRRKVQGESGKILQCLYEDEDEDNKKDMAEVLAKKFVSEVEVAMPWENWGSTSKVIEDGNHMILENHVSILKALFSKYGDFSNRSRLSTKATMLLIMTVCEAIHIMCSTEVVNITTSLLLSWIHSFALAQYANFEIKFVIARLRKLVCAHFGLQADHDVPIDLNLAELGVQIATQLAVVDSEELVIIEQDEEIVDSEELTTIEQDEQIVDSEELAIIEQDEEIVVSEELTITEQDGETDDLRKKVDSMQLTIIELDKAIEELEKKKQTLLNTRKERCIRKECLIDALELKGQMAGTSLL